MEKSLSFVFVTVAASVAIGLIACSSDNGNSTFGGGDAGSSSGTISPIVPTDAGDGSTLPSAAKCDPAIPASFAPVWKAPTVSTTACSAQDIKDYYDNCLLDPNAKDKCSTWTAAHATCTSCIEPADHSGPIQWYDASSTTRLFYTINVAGCLAIKQNATGENDCGGKYNAAVECGRQSCLECLNTGGTFAEFRTCQQSVQQQGICKSYETAMSAACQGVNSQGAATQACFQGQSEAQDVFFQRMETIFCGTP